MERIKSLLQKEEASERLSRLRDELVQAQQQFLNAENLWLAAKVQLEEAERTLTQLEKAKQQLNSKIEENEKQQENLASELPKLHSDFEAINRRINLREKKIKELEAQIQACLAKLEKLENEALEGREPVELAKTRQTFTELQTALTISNVLIKKDAQTAASIQDRMKNCQTRITQLEKEKPKLEQELLDSHKRIESLEAWIKEWKRRESELRNKKEAAEKHVSKIQAEIVELEEKIKTGRR